MIEVRMVTLGATVLGTLAVITSASPTAAAWLDWAMAWILGVGLGVPVLVAVLRGVASEIGLARELAHARPRTPAVPVDSVEDAHR